MTTSTLPPEDSTSPPSSSNPLTLLANLDPSKKYTLVFLMSVGATLLVTGASGGRLMKRAKRMTAEPIIESKPKSSLHLLDQSNSIKKPILPPVPLPISKSRQSLLDLATAYPPIQSSHRPLLKQWSKDKGDDLSFWLPNAALEESSILAAAKGEIYDKVEEGDTLEEPKYVDDGFNPALYAAKAFGIASLLTLGTFAAGIFGVMKYFGVSDLESLSLALSHRVPTVLDNHRPSIPAWALPTPKSIEQPGVEEENEEHKDGIAYWQEVANTLDREASERIIERKARWDKIAKK